jgi:hypothetical protein
MHIIYYVNDKQTIEDILVLSVKTQRYVTNETIKTQRDKRVTGRGRCLMCPITADRKTDLECGCYQLWACENHSTKKVVI